MVHVSYVTIYVSCLCLGVVIFWIKWAREVKKWNWADQKTHNQSRNIYIYRSGWVRNNPRTLKQNRQFWPSFRSISNTKLGGILSFYKYYVDIQINQFSVAWDLGLRVGYSYIGAQVKPRDESWTPNSVISTLSSRLHSLGLANSPRQGLSPETTWGGSYVLESRTPYSDKYCYLHI